MKFDTELKYYFHVRFQQDGIIIDNMDIIWGIIKIDKNREFRENDYICTTQIVETIQIGDETFVKTQNTTYKVNRLIDSIVLPLTEDVIRELRRGISPDELLSIHDSGMKIVGIVDNSNLG